MSLLPLGDSITAGRSATDELVYVVVVLQLWTF